MSSVKRFRLLSLAGSAILIATTPALAQTPPPPPPPTAPDGAVQDASVATDDGEIIVTGLRESLRRAVDIKRNAGNIVDSIVADDIGKLPDQNIAEAIQRIPGVTISRDNGEGQFITVRGLGPAFSTALYNGRILATENQGREFSFDILPAELINRVDVSKTPTASQIEGGIAATVDMYTARPFDFKEGKVALSAQANYDKLRGQFSPQFSGLFSKTFGDGDFGILGAFSYIDRKIEGRRIFTDGWEANQSLDLNKDGTPEFRGVSIPTYVEWGTNSTSRKRMSGLLTAQWRASDTLLLTLDGLYSKLDVNDDNKVFFVYGGPGDVTAATVDQNNTVTSYTGIASGPMFTNQIRPRLATTYQAGANLAWNPSDRLTGTIDFSWSKAKDDTGGNQAWFESNLATPSYSPAAVKFAIGPTGMPVYTGLGNILDTSNAKAGFLTYEGVSVADEIYQVNSALKWNVDSGILTRISGGVNYSDRTKSRFSFKTPDALQCLYCGAGVSIPSSVFTGTADATNFLGTGMFDSAYPTYSAADLAKYLLSDAAINQLANPAAARAALAANGVGFGVIPVPGNSGSAQERTIGGYVEATFGGDFGSRPWSGNIGLRYTRTDVTSRGVGQEILGITTPPGGGDPIVNLSNPQPITARGAYSQLLPSANFKLDVAQDLVFQAAVAKTLTRAASRTGTDGSRSLGFRMKALPQAMATPNIHIGIIAGKLNGEMMPTTPRGWRNECTSTPVDTCSEKPPFSRCALPQANSTTSRPRLPFHCDGCDASISVNLVDGSEYDGGDLVMLSDNALMTAPRQAGSAAAHSADVAHAVTDLTRGVRWSLVVFAHKRRNWRRQFSVQADGRVVDKRR